MPSHAIFLCIIYPLVCISLFAAFGHSIFLALIGPPVATVFLDHHGVFNTVDVQGAVETELLGLNDNGIAVGFEIVNNVTHGIIYNINTGKLTTLDGPNAVSTTFNGINDKGDIVGFYTDAAGNTHGLLETPNTTVTLVGVMDHHTVTLHVQPRSAGKGRSAARQLRADCNSQRKSPARIVDRVAGLQTGPRMSKASVRRLQQ